MKGMLVLVLVAAGASVMSAGYGDETAGQNVWSGVYSAAQADRGLVVYTASCQLCHGDGMRGGPGVPSISGPEFKFKWDGKPAAELFEYVRTMMPPGQVGILNEQQYIDLVAEIFRANGYPAADASELQPDPAKLAGVVITRVKS